jgi:hypothetical protein
MLVMWWFQMLMMPVTERRLPVTEVMMPVTEVMLTGLGRVAAPGTMMAVAAADRRAAAGRHAGRSHDQRLRQRQRQRQRRRVTPTAASSLSRLAAAAAAAAAAPATPAAFRRSVTRRSRGSSESKCASTVAPTFG